MRCRSAFRRYHKSWARKLTMHDARAVNRRRSAMWNGQKRKSPAAPRAAGLLACGSGSAAARAEIPASAQRPGRDVAAELERSAEGEFPAHEVVPRQLDRGLVTRFVEVDVIDECPTFELRMEHVAEPG